MGECQGSGRSDGTVSGLGNVVMGECEGMECVMGG